MDGLVFRIDDISSNTDFYDLDKIYYVIRGKFPKASILFGVNLFCSSNFDGSVYREVPFKERENQFFYKVNNILDIDHVGCYTFSKRPNVSIASHGLLHCDHTRISKDAQEMSILTSCNYLNSKKFIPPFNRFNRDTEDICKENSIDLIKPDHGWKSLEFSEFNQDHKKWYFHSWRINHFKLEDVLGIKSDTRTVGSRYTVGDFDAAS